MCVQKETVGKSSSANMRPVRLLPGRTEQSSCLRSSPLASAGWRQVRERPTLLHLCSPDACVTDFDKNTAVPFRYHIEVCTDAGALMQMKAGTNLELRGVRLPKMHQAALRQGAARQTCWQTRHPRSCSLMMTGWTWHPASHSGCSAGAKAPAAALKAAPWAAHRTARHCQAACMGAQQRPSPLQPQP